MNDSELFVLAADIRFIPVNSLHEKAKNNFDHDVDDVVLTHLHTRKSSKVLDRESAAFLKMFETPKTWAEVIVNFSSEHTMDPHRLAEETVDLLLEMKDQGFLVPYKEQGQSSHPPLFTIEDRFKDYVIKERLQFFDDSEVYKVENKTGQKFALKILKNNNDKHVSFMFKNEIDILRILDGKVNPVLMEEGVEEGFAYLIIEWCDGVGCEQQAYRLRNLVIRENLIGILDLCISIIRAYDHLHRQGILHSDIYPKNILITPSGACKIIDYGISITSGQEKKKIRGGGVGYYFEPEYAASIVEQKSSPPSTEKAEQYSIATVLYYLISGNHYLNFSVERDKLFKQILNDSPVSFQAYDVNLPSELDNIFSVALAKDPEKRFSSLRDFAESLILVRNGIYSSPDFFVPHGENAERLFVDFIVKKFGWNSLFIRKGLALAPACSVNYGASGIAYMYYRIACVREDPKLLELADIWANRAGNFSADFDRAFYDRDMGLTKKTISAISLYHSPTGVYLTQALISHCTGDSHFLTKSVKDFLAYGKIGCDNTDLTLGKSGLLIGCSILLSELQRKNHSLVNGVKLLGKAVIQELWESLAIHPPVNEKNEINYLGIAHGWAGILYATLLWCNQSNSQLPDHFIERVHELKASPDKSDGMLTWPLSISDKRVWRGWCNGSIGHIFLWSLLYDYFDDEQYLAVAKESARYIMLNETNTINNLCCGLAGEAYSFAHLYHVTGEKKYLKEAAMKTDKIMKQISLPALRNNSLYKGDVGLAVLFAEMDKPECLQMPLFEIRRKQSR